MPAPDLVLTRNLTFVDHDRHVIVPQGTKVTIYNRHLDPCEDALMLLARAKGANARAGRIVELVVQINGRPRLIKQADVGPRTAHVSQVAKPKEAPPAQTAPALIEAPKAKQPSLF